MTPSHPHQLTQAVRDHYGRIASVGGSGGGCCQTVPKEVPSCSGCAAIGQTLGYRPEDLSAVPEGANLGLGCGNPLALAELRPGEVVVDLGSGAGFDCFLAGRRVGPEGRVIGVDMTAEMIAKARENKEKAKAANVEFRLGEIEHLPVADNSVDVILSNCVINLAADKAAVFKEAFRVLKPGGRLAVADIVALGPLPEDVRRDLALYTGCVAGAAQVDALEVLLREAGFEEIEITPQEATSKLMAAYFPDSGLEGYIASALLSARKSGAVV